MKIYFLIYLFGKKHQPTEKNCFFCIHTESNTEKKEMLRFIILVFIFLWCFSNSFNSEYKRHLCYFLIWCLATFPYCVISITMIVKHTVTVSLGFETALLNWGFKRKSWHWPYVSVIKWSQALYDLPEWRARGAPWITFLFFASCMFCPELLLSLLLTRYVKQAHQRTGMSLFRKSLEKTETAWYPRMRSMVKPFLLAPDICG